MVLELVRLLLIKLCGDLGCRLSIIKNLSMVFSCTEYWSREWNIDKILAFREFLFATLHCYWILKLNTLNYVNDVKMWIKILETIQSKIQTHNAHMHTQMKSKIYA